MSGKGDTPRPFAVDDKTFSDNWDACFGPKHPEKACKSCAKNLPFSDFGKSGTSYKTICRACERKANADRWRGLSPEQKAAHMERSRAWAKANPSKRKAIAARSRAKDPGASLRRKHRMNGFPEPTRSTPDVCEMCGGLPTGRGGLHLDHCHESGEFRGWLCSKCNQGLGLLGDNLALIVSRVEAYRERTFGAKPSGSLTKVESDNGQGSQPDQEGSGPT